MEAHPERPLSELDSIRLIEHQLASSDLLVRAGWCDASLPSADQLSSIAGRRVEAIIASDLPEAEKQVLIGRVWLNCRLAADFAQASR